ncbi:MAG: hypothetical protein ACXVZT_05180 [Terriglobales bacterium]
MTAPGRRIKTHSAQTGYVYEYYFVGKRRSLPGEAAATEYIFDASADRKTRFSVSVFVPDEAANEWASAHGRALTDPEQYAAAKMRLLQGFDEIEDMLKAGRRLTLDGGEIGALLGEIGVE